MYPKKALAKMMQEIDSPDLAQKEFNDTPYAFHNKTKKLATSSLFFIVYNLEEMNFRIIFQCILGLQVGDLRETSIAVPARPSPYF